MIEKRFEIKDSTLSFRGRAVIVSGNAGVYKCVFNTDFDEKEDLKWFGVFKSSFCPTIRVRLDSNYACEIPEQVLDRDGELKIGVFATNFDEEDVVRLSTNYIAFQIIEGAIGDVSAVSPGELTVWEDLIAHIVPMIGENGTWLLYDIKEGIYKDTGVFAGISEPIIKTMIKEQLGEEIDTYIDDGEI